MPRAPRQFSETGIYHVLTRGANRQEIFHDDNDCERYLEIIERYKRLLNINIYAWCLMNNHVHLLIRVGDEELGVTMKRIGVSYARYYNLKYNTIGHLFQDRYKSEAVESDRYLLSVIRYIHQNPVKAGLAKKPSDWKWSSCREYYEESSYMNGLTDCEFILGLFTQSKELEVKKFKEFNEAENNDKCLDDFEINILKNDEEVKAEITRLIPGVNIAQIKSLPKERRNLIIKKAKKIDGVTQRQLARIFGVSQTLISKT